MLLKWKILWFLIHRSSIVGQFFLDLASTKKITDREQISIFLAIICIYFFLNMAICIFLTSFVIKLHYRFCLIISVSLNVPDHVSPAAFMSRTCQIFLDGSIQRGRR